MSNNGDIPDEVGEGLPPPPRIPDPPSRIEGWKNLSRWLHDIGIAKSVTSTMFAMKVLGRAINSVPSKGGYGHRVFFTSDDLRLLVGYFTGTPYEKYMEKLLRSEPMKKLPEYSGVLLYTLLFRAGPGCPEEIVREADGIACVSQTKMSSRRWSEGSWARSWASASYFTRRDFTEVDLSSPYAERMIVGVMNVDPFGKYSWGRVPGTLFGLDHKVETPLIAPASWAKWPEIRAQILGKSPTSIWKTWLGRRAFSWSTIHDTEDEQVTLLPMPTAESDSYSLEDRRALPFAGPSA